MTFFLRDPKRDPRKQSFTRRTVVLGAAGAGVFGGLTARLYQLQVVQSEQFQTLSDDNQFNHLPQAPSRGRILDRFGVEIAGNEDNYQLIVVPERLGGDLPGAVERILALLSPDGLIEPERFEGVLDRIRSAPQHRQLMIAENLDWASFARVNASRPDLPGVTAQAGETRAYGVADRLGAPRRYADAFAHVVGYVSKPNQEHVDERLDVAPDAQARSALARIVQHPSFRIGRAGIELTQDERLQGDWGEMRVEMDAYGRVVREVALDRATTPGEDLRLTLDARVQTFAQNRLRGESAAAVGMDVETGEVICLVSAPGFDPNLFAAGIHRRAYQALVNDERAPLFNKPLTGLYPPGSTFKMVTALAALRAGISPNERVYCNGSMPLGDRRFHCWRRQGHGAMDMRDAIKRSCDVYFYEIARRLGVDAIAEEARRFGLGERYTLETPGARSGVVPTEAWKRARFDEPWAQGETLITGIGQGFLLASPMQLAVMTARIANGGKPVTPKVMLGDAPFEPVAMPEEGPIADPEHLAMMVDAMTAVCHEWGGTAFYRLDQHGLGMDGVLMAGKTGTSQVRRITEEERASGVIRNEDLPWNRRDHGLFVAFAPVERPRYAIALIVEHGGSGSAAAAPPARDILREMLLRDPNFAAERARSGDA